jgi:non-specific serine/threonine protein kinase
VLRSYRRAAGLTHEALAEAAGLSARTISDLERGVSAAPRRETLVRLSQALGLAPEQHTALEAAARQPVEPVGAVPRPSNLPAELTSFVGRRRELAEVRALLADARLVTLTGAGGCGKTRLALRVAAAVGDGYPDGVSFVDLAPLGDEALLPETLLAGLGLREAPDQAPLGTLTEHLRARRALLVLDNCEHLVAACAGVVDTLLRACLGVRVLATSRELLGVAGEMAWRVPSLTVPDVDEPATAEDLAGCEAVRLLVDRVRLVQPGFAVTDANAPALARLCRRLDGIPLALELAAARVRGMTVEQIADRLDEAFGADELGRSGGRFRLLTGGPRTAPPRHRTLRAMVDWSHDLLAEPERVVLRRLAVFAGGWTLEAAEAVCAGAPVEREDVLDLLLRLVDKSLVIAEEQEREARYRLLETIRRYAEEQLLQAGEAAATRARHLDWYLAWTERAGPALIRHDQARWSRRLAADHDNLRAALTWARAEPAGAEKELRLAAELGRFWGLRGHGREGRAWLADALARGPATATRARATAFAWAGRLETTYGNPTAGRAQCEQGVAVARAVGDPGLVAFTLNQLGFPVTEQDDVASARALLTEAVAAARRAADAREASFALGRLGYLAVQVGDLDAARRLLDEALTLGRSVGDGGVTGTALQMLGELAVKRGERAEARALFDQSIATARAIGFHVQISMGLGRLGDLARLEGDRAAARAAYREGLAEARATGDGIPISTALVKCAGLDADEGRCARAARLLAAEEAWRVSTGTRRPSWHAEAYERELAAARAGLSDQAFAAARTAGQAMTLDQAVADALEDGTDEPAVATVEPPGARGEPIA